jgi:hypothetical protein
LEDAGFFYSANCSGINGEEVPGRIWVFWIVFHWIVANVA